MRDLVIIEDSTIATMLSDASYLEAFPCLKDAAKRLRALNADCRRCKKKVRQEHTGIMDGIRSCLVSLSGPKKNELRRKLNAKRLRVIGKNSRGHDVKFTF